MWYHKKRKRKTRCDFLSTKTLNQERASKSIFNSLLILANELVKINELKNKGSFLMSNRKSRQTERSIFYMSKEQKSNFDLSPQPFLTAGESSHFCPDVKNSQSFEGSFRFSIDRITLIADLDLESWERHFYKWLKLPFVEICNQGLQVLDYSNCKVDDFGNKHAEVPPEQVAFLEMPRFQTGKVRIDFNPNHGMASDGGIWLRNLLNKIPAKRFARADIAIDVFNCDEIKNYEVWQFGMTKKIFFNRSRSMETTYWGSSASEKQIRLYNKKIEQERRHGRIVNLDSWWRLEMQLRGNKVEDYPELVAKMLENFYQADYKSPKLTDSEQNKLVRMRIDPDYYGSLPKKTQQRLRRVIEKAKPENGLSREIAKEFKKALPSLEHELYSYKGQFHLN